MTFLTGVNIKIGNFTFTRVNEVEIEKSTAQVQDTALIKLPLTAHVDMQGQPPSAVETSKLFKVGDAVEISLSYKGYYDAVQFRGYVKSIQPTQPLEVECEDPVWLLRRKNVNKRWASATLTQILQEIVSGTGISLAGDIPLITLAPFELKDVDGAFALQKLADEYGLRAYINPDGNLWCGLAYSVSEGMVKYNLGGDESNVVEADDLKWHNAEDMQIKVKAVNIKEDNTRIEAELGDEDGAVRTLYFYNVESQDQLKQLAQQKLDELKFDGYEGKITTLLIPEALPGMTAELNDEVFPDRSGNYYIESVKTTYGSKGARREVELGIKVN